MMDQHLMGYLTVSFPMSNWCQNVTILRHLGKRLVDAITANCQYHQGSIVKQDYVIQLARAQQF